MSNTVTRLERRIGACLSKDQFALKKRLKKLKPESPGALEQLTQRIERSVALKAARAESIPPLIYPEGLPVVEKKEAIARAILDSQVVILCGETGSGKTTQLPKICLSVGRGCAGMIGHTQPRRIATRSVAARIAEELKQPLGELVGYKVRFHDKTRPETLVKLMTDGVLLAETQADPYLERYDTLIIDEAHERSLNIDFLLGYLKWLLPKRPDLKLIITSATIDPERFSRHFGGAPILEVSGRTYPVEIRYRPVQGEEDDETDRDLQQAILEAVDELSREQGGDILIFLSGEREIRETAEALRKHHPTGWEILPLYARLNAQEQARVFKPQQKRRIVLATNVAETSLTVPGIGGVIDPGHARISRYSARSKLQRLPIEKISQASANQRAGRCGRVGPGICIRLYTQEDFQARPLFTDPEILRTHLAAVILQMKALGLGDMASFPFPEKPDERRVRDGVRLLQEIGALDEQQALTARGRQLAKLPLDPRLGRMLLAAQEENCLTEMAIIVSALSIQDPRERPAEKAPLADEKHARWQGEGSDFLTFLNLWNDFQQNKRHLSKSKLRQYCHEMFLSYVRMREWEDIHQQLLQVIKGELVLRLNQAPADYGEIHRALLTGLLSHIGFKQDQWEYVGARNLKFQIHPGSGLFKSRPKWIVAGEQVETSRVYARTVAKIEPEWIEKCAAHLVKRQHYEPHWERKANRVVVYERTQLYGLTLQDRRKVPFAKIDPAGARELFIRCALVQQDYATHAEFFKYNQALLASLDDLQQKGRRVDLLADEEELYRFYDERIPAWVCDGLAFERWRRQAERENPDLLKLSRAELVRREDERLDENRFPDAWRVNRLAFKLDYRFEPGHPDDGVSVRVPLHQLNQLIPEPFEWVVPGMLRDKIIALIKAMPKVWRKHFVPAPDYADRCLACLRLGEGSLHRALAKALTNLSGLAVSADVFRKEAIPDHLRINFKVIDEKGKVLEASRDLSALQQRYGGRAEQRFETLAAAELSCTGCTDWTFDDLPKIHQGLRQELAGFPALVDEGDSVGVKVFHSEAAARWQHRFGLIRLIQLKLRKEFKYLRKNLPFTAKDALLYGQLPEHPLHGERVPHEAALPEAVLALIAEAVFLREDEALRTQKGFVNRLQEKRAGLIASADEIGRTVKAILESYRTIKMQLTGQAKQDSLLQDIQEQLDLMLYQGFLQKTPFVYVKEMPRYLKAIQYRLARSAYDKTKEARKLEELRPFWTRYWGSVEQGKYPIQPEQDSFRWSLEEFRISLFAQAVKTAYPISAKRLEQAWAEHQESYDR